MITEVLHLLSCIALVAAAIHWLRRHPQVGSHRFLLPFIAVAGLFGAITLYRFSMAIFISQYSGASVTISQGRWILYGLLSLATASPIAAIFPPIGSNPRNVIIIGTVATVAKALFLISTL